MKNRVHLLVGELQRMMKYKILPIAVGVSLIWVLIIVLVEKAEIEPFIPMLILMDAGMMSIMFLSASFFLEKQEGSIKSLLVAPISLADVLLVKFIASLVLAFVSTAMILLAAFIVHGTSVSIVLLIFYVLIIVLSHTAIGYVFTLIAKDFGGMIGLFGLYMLLSLLPSVLVLVNVIPSSLDFLMVISPFYAGQLLIGSLLNEVSSYLIFLSVGYLLLVGILLYVFYVYKKYKKDAIGG